MITCVLGSLYFIMWVTVAIVLLLQATVSSLEDRAEQQRASQEQHTPQPLCHWLRRLGLGFLCGQRSRPPMPVGALRTVSEVPQPRMIVPEGVIEIPLVGSVEMAHASGAPSYNESEVVGDLAAEVTRLKEQLEISFRKEARHMQWYGLADGMRLLELGCGPGWSTLKFAELLPKSTITCVERSSAFVVAARASLAAAACERATVLEGDVLHSGLPSDSFDFVTARFVLQHMPSPARALAEAYRLLRPGNG